VLRACSQEEVGEAVMAQWKRQQKEREKRRAEEEAVGVVDGS